MACSNDCYKEKWSRARQWHVRTAALLDKGWSGDAFQGRWHLTRSLSLVRWQPCQCLGKSVGGKGILKWGIETCIISYKKRITSPGSMQDTGCLVLNVVLICISLLISDMKHLFMCLLAICIFLWKSGFVFLIVTILMIAMSLWFWFALHFSDN